jgi:YcxB-like protein
VEVQITLRVADQEALNKYLLANEKSGCSVGGAARVLPLVLVLGLLLYLAMRKRIPDPGAILIGLVIGFFVCAALVLAVSVFLGVVKFRPAEVPPGEADVLPAFREGPWTFRITPEALSIQGPDFQTINQWRRFTEAGQTGDHLFLLIGKFEAVVIPRHAFAADQEFIHFTELCRRYFDLAKEPTASGGSTGITTHRPTGIRPNPDRFTHDPRA